jgi:fatty acid amide hydrolase 2
MIDLDYNLLSLEEHFLQALLPIIILLSASFITSLLLLRKPRFIVDVINSPPPLALLIVWPIAIPSVISELCVQIFKCRQRSSLPTPENKLLLLPAYKLGEMLRNGEITSFELTTMCIKRIKKYNGQINAVVAERFQDALEESKLADKILLSNKVKPHQLLFGVPIVVKECMELKGLPFTAGITAREGIIGEKDSPTMKRVKDDGMIIVGTTNISEGCMFHESNNGLYGITRNPFDFSRTAGGSSGGCAAAVAGFFTPLAVTSDVGGSTRLPAFYQGLFGHKPTGGIVPNTGTMPNIPPNSKVSKYCQLGPTGRSSFDLFPLLRTLHGPDGIDQITLQTTIPKDISPINIHVNSTLTVYNVTEPFMPFYLRCGLHPEVRACQKEMIDVLKRDYQVNVIHIDLSKELNEFRDSFAIWASMMEEAQEGVVFGEIIHNNNACHLFYQLLLECVTCSMRKRKVHTIPAIGLALLDKLIVEHISNDKLNDAFRKSGQKLKNSLDVLLKSKREFVINDGQEHVVMICPSILCPAPRHHENIIRFTSTSQTSIFNTMAIPVTAVPYYKLSQDGLPMGVQIVGGEMCDHVTIAVANALERSGIAGFPGLVHRTPSDLS